MYPDSRLKRPKFGKRDGADAGLLVEGEGGFTIVENDTCLEGVPSDEKGQPVDFGL